MEFVKANKWLFSWSAVLILVASVLKFVPMPKAVTQFVGLVEVVLALLTGIFFGWKATQTQ